VRRVDRSSRGVLPSVIVIVVCLSDSYCDVSECDSSCDVSECDRYCDVSECDSYCDVSECDI
jgi:hypothetical protein